MKIFLTAVLVLISSNSRAQTNEQIGIKMAECTGWYLSAFTILSKFPGKLEDAKQQKDLGLMTLGFAKKLIGEARTDQISSLPMKQTNQAMKQDTKV